LLAECSPIMTRRCTRRMWNCRKPSLVIGDQIHLECCWMTWCLTRRNHGRLGASNVPAQFRTGDNGSRSWRSVGVEFRIGANRRYQGSDSFGGPERADTSVGEIHRLDAL